jgi:hypothetical protein
MAAPQAIASNGAILLSLSNGQNPPPFQQRLPRQLQPATASLQGIVRNELGLGLGDVLVTLQDVSTGEKHEKHTMGDGVFRFPNVPPGSYILQVSREGFQPKE